MLQLSRPISTGPDRDQVGPKSPAGAHSEFNHSECQPLINPRGLDPEMRFLEMLKLNATCACFASFYNFFSHCSTTSSCSGRTLPRGISV